MTTNKVYIGSTINFKKRKQDHFRHLKMNCHYNPRLQYAYNKHGENNFHMETIEYIANDKLLESEQQHIAKYVINNKIDKTRCFNILIEPASPGTAQKGIPKRGKRFLTIFGETKSIANWARDFRCVVNYSTIQKRLEYGWNAEQAVTTSIDTAKQIAYARRAKQLTVFGETKSVSDWATDGRCVVRIGTLKGRLQKGWDAEQAIITKPLPKTTFLGRKHTQTTKQKMRDAYLKRKSS